MIISQSRFSRPNRRGVALMLVALLLPCFFGLFLLTVDAGRALETHRRAQMAADVAALGIVHRVTRGFTKAEALTHGNGLRALTSPNSMALTYNSGSINTVNNPPLSGAYVGDNRFYEVILTENVQGIFAGALGMFGPTRVVARSVGGIDTDLSPEGLVALNPCAVPGVSLGGDSQLDVQGSIVVNSGGGGLDQYGYNVNLGFPEFSVDIGNNSFIRTDLMMVRGGVNQTHLVLSQANGGLNPLQANIRKPFDDPYAHLPIPKPSNTPSITNWGTKQSVDVRNNLDLTRGPGVYSDISIDTGGILRLTPGVYILSPTRAGQGLSIKNGGTLIANGVMFYVTRSNYLDRSPGYWDELDGQVNSPVTTPTSTNCTLPAPPDGTSNQLHYAKIDIDVNQGSVTMTGLNDPSSPFHNVVIFQRRRSTEDIELDIKASMFQIKGIIYGKWADVVVGNNTDVTMEATMVIGTLDMGGGGRFKVVNLRKNFFLVNETNLFE